MIKNTWMYLSALVGNKKGQTMVEYALIIVVIALFVVGAIALAGDQLVTVFNNIVTELGGAAS